jgi:hypothetical protein
LVDVRLVDVGAAGCDVEVVVWAVGTAPAIAKSGCWALPMGCEGSKVIVAVLLIIFTCVWAGEAAPGTVWRGACWSRLRA